MKKTGVGVDGEAFAAKYLESNGYRILERNFISRFGEIDIIAQLGEYLCFVEVKTRKSGQMMTGFEAVTPAKQHKILKTAQFYLAKHSRHVEEQNLQPRFDCVEVHMDKTGAFLSAEHLENAFAAD